MKTSDGYHKKIQIQQEKIARAQQARARLVRAAAMAERKRANSLKYVLGGACIALAEQNPNFLNSMRKFLSTYIVHDDGRGRAALSGTPFVLLTTDSASTNQAESGHE